ncbi:acetyl esterase [Paraburkholderia youngii]|uniref:alpha/beta hydrolase n=1 Tax=Paraburkholderia youngii TaxID=2782701 RepID=UPI003D25E289
MQKQETKANSVAVHPQVLSLLETIFRPQDTDVPLTVDGVRFTNDSELAALVGPGEAVAQIWPARFQFESKAIEGRWYLPSEAASSHVIVFVHGGGWVSGDLNSYDTLCRSMALRSGALVLSVDYGRSPENPFLAAIKQVKHVLEHVRTYVAEFGCNEAELSVAADSAGAQVLAAALHLLAESNRPVPDSAVFIYPALDATMQHDTWTSFGSGYRLTRRTMEWYWTQYLGRHPGELGAQAYDPCVSPIYSHHLAQFPRSLVVTAACDPLRAEGEEFFHRLSQAGVDSEYLMVPGQIHGFLRFRKAFTDPEWGADAVMERICKFLIGSRPA